MLRRILHRAIAWYNNTPSILTTPLSATECWHGSGSSAFGVKMLPPLSYIARHAIMFVCTHSVQMKMKDGRETKLIVGQKVWCLDGQYYIAEDVSLRGEYRIRRGTHPLDTYTLLSAYHNGKVLPCFDTERYNVLVEING